MVKQKPSRHNSTRSRKSAVSNHSKNVKESKSTSDPPASERNLETMVVEPDLPKAVQVKKESDKYATTSEEFVVHKEYYASSRSSHPSYSADRSEALSSTCSSGDDTKEDSRHPAPSVASSRGIKNIENIKTKPSAATVLTHDVSSDSKSEAQKSLVRAAQEKAERKGLSSSASKASTVAGTVSSKTVVSTAISTKQSAATVVSEIDDIKLSSQRLDALVIQLRDSDDEKEAATAILEIALRIKGHEVVSHGIDLSIINAMKRFSNSHKIQTRGCKALAELASKSVPSIESIMDKGGSDIIMVAMEKHRAEEDLQKEASKAIECITKKNKQGKGSFGPHAGHAIESLLHAMADHLQSPKLQCLALQALNAIAEGSPECSQCIVDKRGLDSIRRTLRSHDGNTEVIDKSFELLITITTSVHKCELDEEIAMTISIERVLATMLLFRPNETIQCHGIALLCRLCKESARNRTKVSSLYGLEIITKSLESCMTNKEVLRHGATLIQYLCHSEGNAVAAGLISEGGMELLLNIIRRHGSDPAIVRSTFLIIAKMARPFADKIRKEGGIELILSGMHIHEVNVNVQKAACLALWKLSGKTENANIISGNGGVALINSALSRFSEDEGLTEVACEALATLSHDKQIMIAHQTLKARAVAVQKHPKQQATAVKHPSKESWLCGGCF